MKKEIALPANFTGGKLEEFLERLPYVSEAIQMVQYVPTLHQAEITMETDDESAWPVLDGMIGELIETLTETRIIKQKVVFDNTERFDDCHEEQAMTQAPNENFYSETDILLRDRLDGLLYKVAQKYKALIREYPTILTADNMAKNSYHKNFPQNVYAVSSLPHNYNLIKQIRESNSNSIPQDMFRFEGSYLQPCICYHCYQEITDQFLSKPVVFSGKGQCFRHEIQWKTNQFRRNEFTMREIVFVGEADWVLETRDSIMKDVWRLFEELELCGRIVTARDPFFHYDDMKNKGMFQMMSNAKYELEAHTTTGKSSSIASFNYCEDLLCKKFNIQDESARLLHSGCVAFGIDRWRAAIVDRFGNDPEQWPTALRYSEKEEMVQ